MKDKTLHRAARPVVPFLLPVRTQQTWWQIVKSWFQQGWQRLWRPRIQIQPPLQIARHKPFPQRPHQRRRRAVFAALDAAPTNLTRRQLIAHVRAVTGVGCSEKLITQWRQEQQHAPERPNDALTRRRRMMGLLLCLCLNSCAMTTVTPSMSASEIIISHAPSASESAAQPRLLRIQLTLNAPHELQVKAGQHIEAGALLSDRHTARQRLLIQQRALQTVAYHLRRQNQLANESLQQFQSLGRELPPTTFAAEQAAVKRAEIEALAAQPALATQQARLSIVRNLSSVAALPTPAVSAEEEWLQTQTTDDGQLTLDQFDLIQSHEAAKLTQMQDAQLFALSEIELHKAKLASAREVRGWEEQKHRVEVTRQWLSARSQQQQAAIEAARLTAQLAEIELQLAQLTAVRAPFAGTIKRIEWEEMHDEQLTVVVYLSVHQ